jgi:hypothetical protein
MKKSFNNGLVLSILTIFIISSAILISCTKQSDIKDNEINITSEVTWFIEALDSKNNSFAGELIINTKTKKVSKNYYDLQTSVSEFNDIIGPIINKLDDTNSEEYLDDDSAGGTATCKYCGKWGGISCGNEIAGKIPKNAGEITVKISKADSKGCRTITAIW